MHIVYAKEEGLHLEEADDFRRFKLVLRGVACGERPEISGITFVDDENVLVAIDLVPRLPGTPSEEGWAEGYAKMLEAAARYGWIDDDSKSIRAHVERER